MQKLRKQVNIALCIIEYCLQSTLYLERLLALQNNKSDGVILFI